MKRKGFTLIELLAVIVILAIIALIATPIVLDIIDDSKTSSVKRSIELYGKAVENSVAKEQLNGSIVPSGKYTTADGKTLTNGNTTIKVDYDGAKTVCDVYISSEGTVSLKKCNVSDKDVEYTYGNKIYENGAVVYFDVTTGKTCNNYTEENSNTGYNGISGTENQNGCLKFYAFNDFGNDKLNLILDHNTTATMAWNSSGSNINGPSEEFLNKLNEDTKDWQGTEMPTNYSINLGEGKANYTIDYSTYKARIITASEVANIVSTDRESFYFDSKDTTASEKCTFDSSTGIGDISGCQYGWLYDRTSSECTNYGCLNNSSAETFGYWTSTATSSKSTNAFRIYFYGYMNNINVNSEYFGIRPVIEVLKSNLE